MPEGSVSHNRERWRRVMNALFVRASGGEKRPRLMATADVFREGLQFEQEFPAILQEVQTLLENHPLTRYGDIDPARAAEVATDWRLFYIMAFGKADPDAAAKCPTIATIASRIPRVFSVTLALLPPRVGLKAHTGPFAGMLRYHLGLIIPAVNPPRIRVDETWHTWQRGESIVLDDSFEHEVVNESEELRVILMVDFFRPMNALYEYMNRRFMYSNGAWSNAFFERANRGSPSKKDAQS